MIVSRWWWFVEVYSGMNQGSDSSFLNRKCSLVKSRFSMVTQSAHWRRLRSETNGLAVVRFRIKG
ncbi:hypothetical protein GYH30_047476 [Glycine max]|nr:hypothetical protein GYH30_047476 [Glycine max]